ncbi:MAG: enoyl-CoA hydratase/isomerase family protein [Hyphomicrobiales bacterium]|nr:enoyl-CoA hydratase/isomerase family protein [Hyphomicrobiales bacterium]
MTDHLIITQRNGGHLQVTLNRPGKANALSQVMLHQLHDIFADAAHDRDLRALSITGTGGRVFCGGADLTEVSFDPDDPSQEIWDDMAKALAAVPVLTIAMINGACIGGGMTLALGCDIRVCVPQSVFGYPVLQNGILLGDIDAARLRALVGPGRASLFLLGAARILADEALSWGLVDRIVEPVALEAAVTTLCTTALAADRDHLAALKVQCREGRS